MMKNTDNLTVRFRTENYASIGEWRKIICFLKDGKLMDPTEGLGVTTTNTDESITLQLSENQLYVIASGGIGALSNLIHKAINEYAGEADKYAVLTWNVGIGSNHPHKHWEIPGIAKQITDCKPDVFFLQEFPLMPANQPPLRDLKDELKNYSIFSSEPNDQFSSEPNDQYTNYGFIVGVRCNSVIKCGDECRVEDPVQFENCPPFATILTSDPLLVNLHLVAGNDENRGIRSRQLRLLKRRIAGRPFIVGGDFNFDAYQWFPKWMDLSKTHPTSYVPGSPNHERQRFDFLGCSENGVAGLDAQTLCVCDNINPAIKYSDICKSYAYF